MSVPPLPAHRGVTSGCQSGHTTGGSGVTQSVVLLVLDAVRKDYFDAYATELPELADLSFTRCYAPSSWSAPSHASMLTGDLPSTHGIHAHNIDMSGIDPKQTFLPSVSTGTKVGVSSNIFAGTPYGFDEYFDEFTSVSRHAVFAGGLAIDEFLNECNQSGIRRYADFLSEAVRQGVFARSLVNGASLKLDEATRDLPLPRLKDYGTRLITRHIEGALERDPSFVFANLMEAHAPLRVSLPYSWRLQGHSLRWHSDREDLWDINNATDIEPYESYLETYRGVYAAAVQYLDRQVSALVERVLQERDDVTFIVTADHGENLGYPEEEGLLGHVGSLSDSLVHVPFVVINPPTDLTTNPDELVSLLDLPALIHAITGTEHFEPDRTYAPAERIGLGLDTNPPNVEYWDRMIRRVVRDDGVAVEWDSLGNAKRFEEETSEEISADRIPEWATSRFDTPLAAYKNQARNAETKTSVDTTTRDRLEDLGYL